MNAEVAIRSGTVDSILISCLAVVKLMLAMLVFLLLYRYFTKGEDTFKSTEATLLLNKLKTNT